eukprot:5967428-Alexandrium_andersonii.AAC.1
MISLSWSAFKEDTSEPNDSTACEKSPMDLTTAGSVFNSSAAGMLCTDIANRTPAARASSNRRSN